MSTSTSYKLLPPTPNDKQWCVQILNTNSGQTSYRFFDTPRQAAAIYPEVAEQALATVYAKIRGIIEEDQITFTQFRDAVQAVYQEYDSPKK